MQHTNAFLEGHFRMGRGSIHVPDVVEPLFIKLPDGSKRFGIRAMFCLSKPHDFSCYNLPKIKKSNQPGACG